MWRRRHILFAPRVPLCRRGLRPPRPPAALILTPMPKDIVISRPASFDPATATRRRLAVPSALASPLFGRRIGRTEVHQATEQQCSPPLPRPHHARDSYLPADHVYAPHGTSWGSRRSPPRGCAWARERPEEWPRRIREPPPPEICLTRPFCVISVRRVADNRHDARTRAQPAVPYGKRPGGSQGSCTAPTDTGRRVPGRRHRGVDAAQR
jgi:hypothetical protein